MADTDPQNLPVQHEKEAHLLDYLHVLQRRWRIAFIIFVIIFSGVAAKTFTEIPIYESGVTLRYGLEPDTSQQILEKRKEHYFSVDSEIRVIRSFAVAERAAEMLNLSWQHNPSCQKADLYIRRLDIPLTYDQVDLQVVDQENFRLLDVSGNVLVSGRSRIPFEKGQVRGLIDLNRAESGHVCRLTRMSVDQAVAFISQGLSARALGEDYTMLRISVQRTDPRVARDVADAVAKAYREQSFSAKTKEAETTLRFIDEQLAKLGDELNVSEQSLQEFKIRTGLERLTPEGESVIDAAVALEKRRADLLFRKQQIAGFIETYVPGSLDFSSVQDVQGVPDKIERLQDLRLARKNLLRDYTTSHPAVVDIEDKMGLIRDDIFASARAEMNNIDQQVVSLEASLEQSGKKLDQVPAEEIELVRLSRVNAVNAELYTYLLQRQQESRISRATLSSNVEIIDQARVPHAPIRPDVKKNLMMGFLFALLGGFGIVFLLDYLDRTVKDEEDVQEKLGLPVVGTIPKIASAVDGGSSQLVTALEPLSPASESFLALRTNMLFLLTNAKHRTIMVTSCLPDEGKSTVAVNLAATLAQTGAKTLLAGCDLRRPSLYEILDQTETPGLTDLLVSRTKKALRHIEVLNLDFIPAGTEPPNPTQILNSDEMTRLMEKARERYDYVVIDVPPLLPVADALILASKVDLNLLVIESCRIPEKIARRALQSLKRHDAEIAGVVLNDKTGKGAKYYGAYSYYDGKYYQGYYRRDEVVQVAPVWRRFFGWIWKFING